MAAPSFISATALGIGTSSTPGAQAITVPSDAQGVLVFHRGYQDPRITSLTSNFSGSFTITQDTGSEITSISYAAVTSTGSKTITPVFANNNSEGPIFIVAFVKGIDNSAPANWINAVYALANDIVGSSFSHAIVSTNDALVLAMDSHYNTGLIPPANESGWTSLVTQGINSEGGRLRSADSPGASTTSATTQGTSYRGIAIVSIIGATGGATTHDATSALANAGASTLGSATRTTSHAATGAIASSGGSTVGAASSATTRAASGELTNPGAVTVGSSARTRVHAATGVIENPGGATLGTAARTRAHPATGTLSNPGAKTSGAASSATTRSASGVLAGAGGQVSGSAERVVVGGTHDATGALKGAGAVTAGSAARSRAFASSGVLSNSGAQTIGSAARTAGPVSHDSSGVLYNSGAIVSGNGERSGSPYIPDRRGGGVPRRNYLIQGKRYTLADWELRLLLQQLIPARSEVQVVEKEDVKQISRKLWKRLRETDSALGALTFKQVDAVVQESTIEYDEDEELVMLLL